ncbi:DegT/DnrJ/EryC1/StrS family aminotransferase [Streptomyces kaniharaensis]|uniref:DegT/DnrJ/EryC1/StrS family aminotransferase n=1 Tax=Streptomyces kaniharaensis TaxID=212423 RepID=UPI0018A84F03|nr:DegT/DnrJ/EryC1/StrS family aminotransferase [Streptomyces kaniharaensis]
MIPPFRTEFTTAQKADFLTAAAGIVDSGRLTLGPYTRRLETAFTATAGTQYAIAVSSGTTAIEITLRALGLTGADILVPANTNYATAEAVLRAGARPVLYDAGLAATLDAIDAARTPATRAVILVHLGGHITPDLDKITDYCTTHNLLVVEDAAHAHGSSTGGRPAGSLGAAAAFSTFATKILTTGEGGLITTDDPHLADLARQYRDQGKNEDGHNTVFGSAWRLPELSAALGLVQLTTTPTPMQRAHDLLRTYAQRIRHPQVSVPFEPGHRYSGHKAIIQLPSRTLRDHLRRHLTAAGITPARGVYDNPLHHQPALGLTGAYPLADHFADTHLCLPLWLGLTPDQQHRVIDTVNAWNPPAA